jgi:hypothetical protein
MPRFRQVEKESTAVGPISAPPRGSAAKDSSGQVLQQFGKSLSEMSGYMRETYQRSQADMALANATKKLQDFTLGLREGFLDEETGERKIHDPETHVDLYQEEVNRISEEATRGLAGGALSSFNSHFRDFSTRQEFEVKSNAIDQFNAKTKANLDATLAQGAVTFVDGNLLTKNIIQNNMMSRIDEAEKAGVISPQEALARREKFTDDTETGSFLKLLRQDPDAAANAIRLGEFSKLNAEKQQKLLSTAIEQGELKIRRQNAEYDRQQTRMDRAQRKTEERTAKQLFKKYMNGTLTPLEVEQNIDNLSPEKFELLMKKSQGGDEDAVTDVTIYSDLRRRASQGEDIRLQAEHFASKGLLKMDALDRLYTMVESNPGVEAENWGKSGKRYLDLVLLPDPNTASGFEKQAQADAQEEWSRWVAAHPGSNPADARKEYIRIAESYWTVNKNELRITTPIPRFHDGGRAAFDRSALHKAIKKTKESFQKKEIDKAIYDEEQKKLLRWKRIFDSEARIEAEKAAKAQGDGTK